MMLKRLGFSYNPGVGEANSTSPRYRPLMVVARLLLTPLNVYTLPGENALQRRRRKFDVITTGEDSGMVLL